MNCDTSEISDAMKVLTCINSDVSVTPSENLWKINVLCPSHVVLMTMEIKMDGETDGAKFGLSAEDFLSVLKLMKGDTCEITREDARLVVKSGRITRSMGMNVASDLFPSKIMKGEDMDCHIGITAGELLDAINVLSSVGEEYDITYTDGTVKLNNHNEKGDDSSYVINEGCRVNEGVNGDVHARYGVEYISNVIKRIPKTSELLISYSKNMPMIAEYVSDAYEFRWVCAPLINNDEE